MKFIPALVLAASAAIGQVSTASIAGRVIDAKTQKPIPAAFVSAIRANAPPFSRTTKTGGDGAFRIEELPAGNYSLCVQVPGDAWLDPCQWDGNPVRLAMAPGKTAPGILIKLITGSILTVQVKDNQNKIREKTKRGTQPDLAIGVWGPRGFYYPAQPQGTPGTVESLQGADKEDIVYIWKLAIPRDTPLKLHVSSRELRLGDKSGTALAGNGSQQVFQHSTANPNPPGFAFTVLGLTP